MHGLHPHSNMYVCFEMDNVRQQKQQKQQDTNMTTTTRQRQQQEDNNKKQQQRQKMFHADFGPIVQRKRAAYALTVIS